MIEPSTPVVSAVRGQGERDRAVVVAVGIVLGAHDAGRGLADPYVRQLVEQLLVLSGRN